VSLVFAVFFAILGAAALWEMRTSTLQARWLAPIAAELTWSVEEGPSPQIVFPGEGPYDLRLGYTALPAMIESAGTRGFRVVEQARVSDRFLDLVENRDLFPIFREKSRAGLEIADRSGASMFSEPKPARAYPVFESVPPVVWQTLLYIENRTMLDPDRSKQNPAVEWSRLIRSVVELGLRSLGREGSVAGASTLATQIEKFRHAPDGLTESPRDKLLQMASASLRGYLGGEETLPARRQIVLDYLNSVPLAAQRGEGEVTGLGDGLWAWYGRDFESANRLLASVEPAGSPLLPAPSTVLPDRADPAAAFWPMGGGEGAEPTESDVGSAFREVLSLLIAQRRPSYYLTQADGRRALAEGTNEYLDLLEEAEVIPAELAAAARNAEIEVRSIPPERPSVSFVERKGVNAVRTQLLGVLGVPRLYDLDRFDLRVRTTLDAEAQRTATDFLVALSDPEFVHAQGFDDTRLLDRGEPELVVYSFVLHERTERGNLVRIQTDNLDAPFNLNESARLELGSTAKLRTLASYLEIVAELHGAYSTIGPDSLRALPLSQNDQLALWARAQILGNDSIDLATLLRRAMGRSYSANPSQRFVTGGGVQTFSNFDNTYDARSLTVTEGFRQSVNLVFVRLMRDIVNHYVYRVPGSTAYVLDDPDSPLRQDYLERFADREGIQFLNQFIPKFQGKSRSEILQSLVADRRLTPQRIAWAYRAVAPDPTPEEFEFLLRANQPEAGFTPAAVLDLYARADPEGQPLADLGYLASIHPLELWVARHVIENPAATRTEMISASEGARQDVYAWLFRTSRQSAQDQRIRSLLEVEAFTEILAGWRRLGYPFENIVPSLGTSIGSSGDRPAALGELVGIILNDGVRQPTYRLEELHFAEGTPYETRMLREGTEGERVMPSEVAVVLREAMVDVVEEGTARRMRGAIVGPDGVPLVVGGKTGTGDNRYRVFAPGGRLVESRSVNRTSTFVFFIGDRYYGVITAYVPGEDADRFWFTSALPTQILRALAPAVQRLMEEGAAAVQPTASGPGAS